MTATAQQGASSRKNSLSELEEGLPLYAELQYTESQSDVVPHAKASPMGVSEFLVHLLTDSRDMSTDGARRLAALWTKGTGQELRSYSPAMYFEIFGTEDGWIVYREVHLAIHREKSREFWYTCGNFVLLAIAFCIEIIAIGFTVAGANHLVGERVLVGAIYATFFNSFFCIGAIIAVASRDHEKGIERELRRALNKAEAKALVESLAQGSAGESEGRAYNVHTPQFQQSQGVRFMSNGSPDVQQRPSAWQYVSFSSPRRRSSSTVLPKRETTDARNTTLKDKRIHNEFMSEKVKNAWMNQGQRSRYLKTAGIVAFVLLVLYYIVPSGAESGYTPPGVGKFPGGDVASDSTTGTARCTRSYDKNKPLIQYALMVDAGSTGSRIHVYRFNNCGPTPELENEDFKMTAKKEGGSGLSSYGDDAEGAAKSLDVLLDVAMEKVPDKLKGCTPIAVKATAGLRKLGAEKSDAILKAVRERLETQYPFPLVSDAKGGVQVMDGKDEGVYAWITTNYLLGKIGGPDKTPTAAVFDLGGGSTQIVFQPTFPEAKNGGLPEQMAEGDHKYALSFGGRDFTLYQHSYLGYGLMEARNNLHRVVVEGMYENSPESKAWLSKPISNPCLAPGSSKQVEVQLEENHPLGKTVTVNMTGPATTSVAAPANCRALAEKTLKKESTCKLAPCAFNGVHQPSLEKTFAREDVYLFSYFYDRTQPLGMPESFTLRELHDLTSRVCAGGDAWKVFESVPGALEELNDRPDTCLDLNFMLALLHTGYEMPIDREVKIAKKIKGNELGWCLGASLPLLSQESGWSCKISKVN